MTIKLYSNGCPRCKILKQKLDLGNISYTVSDNLDEVMSKGIISLPVLDIGAKIMDFYESVKWIKEVGEKNKCK